MYTIWNTKKKLQIKRFPKIVSFKQCLKGVEIFCDFNYCGRLFQILADALENARSPSVFFDRRERSSNWILVLERRFYVEVLLMATILFK